MYRPEGIKIWYEKTKPLLLNQGVIPPQTEYPIVISSEFEWEVLKRRCFEAGADAMLEGLRRGATQVSNLGDFPNGKGVVVFIPEE